MNVKRRFYKTVSITDDLGIALDGKVVKTPLKHPLRLPNRPLAEAVAAEWDEQEDKIEPIFMVLTKLANTAIDFIAPNRGKAEEVILAYANSDLVCYRAPSPDALVLRQCGFWDPVIAWAKSDFGAAFETRVGVVHERQPEAALQATVKRVANLDSFQLSALQTITEGTGSALLALMLARGAIEPVAAWKVAYVDEDYQREEWGIDVPAAVRRMLFREDFDKACEFLALARDERLI